MDTKKDLTAFFEEPRSRPEVAALLAEAGLELWQAPDGFWAVRLKGSAPANAQPRTREPARRARRAAR